MRILMVCHGNICRSPMAEVVARALLDEARLTSSITVESFGTSGYHAGEPIDARAAAALARRGWPKTGHRARQLRRSDLVQADLVLCADRANRRDAARLGQPAGHLRMLRWYEADGDTRHPSGTSNVPGGTPVAGSDHTGARWGGGRWDAANWNGDEVPDPWAGDDAAFDTALHLIERSCRGLVQHVVAGAG